MDALTLFLESGLAAAIVIVAGVLARKYLIEVITQAVRFDFDAELEKLRAELRQKESQIVALREGALARMISIQSAVAARRMQAADELWGAVVGWNELLAVVTTMGMVNFENASANIAREPKLRDFFKSLQPGDLLGQLRTLGALAENARPYLSDLSWALFTAYRSIFIGAAAKAHMFSNGIDPRPYMNASGIDQLLLVTLPDQRERIERGPVSHAELIDVLRTRILEELRRSIEGKEQDSESVRRAAEIVTFSAALDLQSSQMETKAKLPAQPPTS